LSTSRICEPESVERGRDGFLSGALLVPLLCGLVTLSLLTPQIARTQEAETPAAAGTPVAITAPVVNDTLVGTTNVAQTKTRAKEPVESEIIVEGMASYGHYKIFASGSGCKLYTGGVEYDRHSWGYFLKARMDYVAEILPLILLDTADKSDIWGTPTTTAREVVPGVGFSPIGFRMLWRNDKAWMPYLEAKGGILVFDKKVLSQEATYESFSLQSAVGLKTRLTDRVDLRLGLFSDFHFSNAFMVPVNPGLDVMNANFGLSYHLGAPRVR
jgi:hypothetical protein